MDDNEKLIRKFYDSLGRTDANGMIECYDEHVEFEDPAFGRLHGKRAKDMWRMLCQSQKDKDFKIVCKEIKVQGKSWVADVEAFYTFTKTGRSVHNKIKANFIIEDGKIIQQKDEFDLYRWSRQAFGPIGFALGWTPYFKNKLQKQTNKMLDKYISKTS